MSLRRQCQLLDVPRSTYYHEPLPEPQSDLDLMRELDELYLKYPTWGSRKLVMFFALDQRIESRGRITRLRRLMGVETIYQRPRTSQPGSYPQKFPYLLRGLAITVPNQVWCADITYIPMAHSFLYLFAIMDWATRTVLDWELSNTLDEGFCIACLQRLLASNGARKPGIFNTDQGAQFTGRGWILALQHHQIKISHDGKGRWMDNVFIERLWRSLKYDDIYLRCYADGVALYRGLTAYFICYNTIRPHAALEGRTPSSIYDSR
jgi:putative transposase